MISQRSVLSSNSAAEIRPGVKRFGYLLIASSLMSYVPQLELMTLPCLATLVYFIIRQVASGQVGIHDDRTFICGIFLLQCCLSLFVLNYNGYGLEEWVRAIAPFMLFALLFMLPKLNDPEQHWLAHAIFIAGACWALKILTQAVLLALQGSDVFSVRLTFRVIDSVIVFPLVMVPYLLLVPQKKLNIFRWPALAAVLLMYVWIGYRAGLAFITLPFFLFVALQIKRFNFVPIILCIFTAFAITYSVGTDLFGLGDRFSKLGDESTGARGYEWQYAIDSFLESPIVGKGMGWQVPTIFIETDDPFFVNQPATVGFVHSAIAYFAMDMGILGVLNYYLLTMPRFVRGDTRHIQRFATIALILITLFCLTQAAFRTAHTILLIVALIRINRLPVQMGHRQHKPVPTNL